MQRFLGNQLPCCVRGGKQDAAVPSLIFRDLTDLNFIVGRAGAGKVANEKNDMAQLGERLCTAQLILHTRSAHSPLTAYGGRRGVMELGGAMVAAEERMNSIWGKLSAGGIRTFLKPASFQDFLNYSVRRKNTRSAKKDVCCERAG